MSENEEICIDTKEEINKKRGKRLSECRNHRNMTQVQLAEICNISDKYLSMMECGQRPIDWDKAVLFSKALDVSASYIMCESDIASIGKQYHITDLENYGSTDRFFLWFLRSYCCQLRFIVVYPYEDNQPRNS